MPTAPDNYRTNPFFLFNKAIIVAGMAAPHNNDGHHSPGDLNGIKWAIGYVKNTAKSDVLIGLHESENFSSEAGEIGVEYHC